MFVRRVSINKISLLWTLCNAIAMVAQGEGSLGTSLSTALSCGWKSVLKELLRDGDGAGAGEELEQVRSCAGPCSAPSPRAVMRSYRVLCVLELSTNKTDILALSASQR